MSRPRSRSLLGRLVLLLRGLAKTRPIQLNTGRTARRRRRDGGPAHVTNPETATPTVDGGRAADALPADGGAADDVTAGLSPFAIGGPDAPQIDEQTPVVATESDKHERPADTTTGPPSDVVQASQSEPTTGEPNDSPQTPDQSPSTVDALPGLGSSTTEVPQGGVAVESGEATLPEGSSLGAGHDVSTRVDEPARLRDSLEPYDRGPAARDRRPPQPSGKNVLPERYLAWNRVMIEYCLLGPASGTAYLTVTPAIIAAAWFDAFHEGKSAEEAAADFAASVAAAYRDYVLSEPDGLWVLARVGDDALPNCAAFLALSVLAAYEMRTDEDAGPNAFYARLAELLGVDIVSRHPRGFTTSDFQALWELLAEWISEHTETTLAMPSPGGARPFIALPLTHAPLRRMDTEKLPDFFAWAAYEPGGRLERDALERDLVLWQRSRSQLSRVGAAALADDRRAAVVAQVLLEFEAWDGSSGAATGRRSAAVHLHLDFVRRQPILHCLARRPPDFPREFDDGTHLLEAAEDGWYEPIHLPPDAGAELASGFTWTMATGAPVIELRRPASAVIPLAPAKDATGFLSRGGLVGGLQCAVLCSEALVHPAQEYLSFVAERRCKPVNHASVPNGWQLFPAVLPSRPADGVPYELAGLHVSFRPEIVAVGGLRLARRSAWLAGAAPRVLIGGGRGGLAPKIDGADADLCDDGALDDGGRLDAPGIHLIEAGATRRRIEVIDPDVNVAACLSLVDGSVHDVVALPEGHWTVVGSRTDEVIHTEAAAHGAIARLTFDPQWAICLDSPSRTTVLCLSERSVAPTGGSFDLTAAQSHALDDLADSQSGARVVGIVGELAPGSHGWPPIIRYASGIERVLTQEGNLVSISDIPPLPANSPQLEWASVIDDAGHKPGSLGTSFSGVNKSFLRESWDAYYEAAHGLKHHWQRARQ